MLYHILDNLLSAIIGIKVLLNIIIPTSSSAQTFSLRDRLHCNGLMKVFAEPTSFFRLEGKLSTVEGRTSSLREFGIHFKKMKPPHP